MARTPRTLCSARSGSATGPRLLLTLPVDHLAETILGKRFIFLHTTFYLFKPSYNLLNRRSRELRALAKSKRHEQT